MKKNLKGPFKALKSWIHLHILFMLVSIGLYFAGTAEMNEELLLVGAALGVLSFLFYFLYINSLIKLFDSILKTSVFDDLKNDN